MHFLFVIAYTCYTLFVVIMQCGTSRSCQVLIFALFTIFSSWRMTQIHQARWLIESLQIFSVTYGFLLKFQRSVKRPFKREVEPVSNVYITYTSIAKMAIYILF